MANTPNFIETIVISTRIRLARNFAAYPFPKKLDEAQAEDIAYLVGEGLKEFDEFEKLIGVKDDPAETVFISTDINEIREWFDGIERRTGKKREPKDYTIELYWIDEEGDFLDGSDYDYAERFLEVNADV